MSKYTQLIETIINSCQAQDAVKFASLFVDEGEIQLSNNQRIKKSDIETVTADYFSSLKYIKIKVLDIVTNDIDNLARIEWIWQDYNLSKNQAHQYHNHIILEFQDDLIYRWREYQS